MTEPEFDEGDLTKILEFLTARGVDATREAAKFVLGSLGVHHTRVMIARLDGHYALVSFDEITALLGHEPVGP